MKISKLPTKDGSPSQITQVGHNVRIEPGPMRRREVASEEILSDDVTASHYHAPKEVDVIDKATGKPTGEKETVVAVDSFGKPIDLGQPFDFVDWKSEVRAWNVYRLETVEAANMWVHKGSHANEQDALSQAVELASE
jgi:hypothetical protein